jgi:hypothetical protein
MPRRPTHTVLPHQRPRCKAFCQVCPVTNDCLTWALAIDRQNPTGKRYGIFGGLTPTERDRYAAKLNRR